VRSFKKKIKIIQNAFAVTPRLVDASQNHSLGGNMVDSDYESCASEDSGESNWFDVLIPTGYQCGELIVARIQHYGIRVHVPCPDQGDGSRIWLHIPPSALPAIESLNSRGIVPSAVDFGLKV
jgi:hypothetical protein